MAVIIPAIIPTSQKDLEEKLAIVAGVTSEAQIDIVDGVFAKPASWPYIPEATQLKRMERDGDMLPEYGRLGIEIDLMSADPESVAGSWIAVGATRLTIHAESTRYLPRLIDGLRADYGHEKDFAPGLLSIGLALNIATDIALIEPYLSKIEYVQFMDIRQIGRQGEAFDPAVLRKINLFRHRHPTMPIQVDGGVTLSSAPLLLDAGVSRLVVGSALWKAPDFKEAYAQFVTLTQLHGIYE